jgi:putative membrane protein
MTLLANPQARRRTWLRYGALAAVVLVPLAFAGLFVAALSQSDTALDRIPAAIVNEDSLITTTNADGTESNVFAGRLLVTQLTGADAEGFEWTITNAEDAEKALANGEVYAVLTVPSNFSKSIMSIQTDTPEKAEISIRTDDSHSYLTGAVVQAVGQGMVGAFGNEITAQVIGGIYSSLGELGTSLQSASDGASQLSDGATQLSDGLSSYTGGVTQLSNGLKKLNTGAAGLSTLSDGVSSYTGGVSQLSAGLSQLSAALASGATVDPAVKGQLDALTAQLAAVAANGPALDQGLSTAASGIQSGISQSSSGAATLAANGPALVSGASELATGASTLADGLASGADQVPAFDEEQSQASAEVASDPVNLTVSTDNQVSEVGQAIATFFVPLGLWIGALAVFLVLRPVTRRALASTANNGRLVLTALLRAGAVTAAQAVLLVALLHVSLGVDWSYLPATAGFALLTAFAFTAFHYLLTIGLGRAGLVVSLFIVAVQITSTGGIYPIELVSTPFQVISPLLPLTYSVSGMQAILAGGSVASAVTAALVLAGFGVGSVLLSLLAIRRTRRATAIGLLPRPA